MNEIKTKLVDLIDAAADTIEQIGRGMIKLSTSLDELSTAILQDGEFSDDPISDETSVSSRSSNSSFSSFSSSSDPVVPPPNKKSIYGWNIGTQGYWRPARHFVNKLWGCNKLVREGAKFDRYGNLIAGSALTRIVLDEKHTKPGQYEISWEADGIKKTNTGYNFTGQRIESAFNLTGEMSNLTLRSYGGSDPTAQSIFDDAAYQRLKGTACLRWMDLLYTNRPQATGGNYYRYDPTEQFIYETIPPHMAAVNCNGVGADCWWNVHHLDTEEEIRSALEEFKTTLRADLKVYIEHSNEVWLFRWKDGPPTQNELFNWHNARTKQIGKLAKEILGDRAVVVLGTQAADSTRTKLFLRNGVDHIDAIAIAPYWGWESSAVNNVNRWLSGGVGEVLRFLAEDEIKTRQWILDQKQVAKENGLRLVAYEHGSHLWLDKTAPNRDQVNQIFLQANRSEELAKQYEARMDFWENEVNDLSCWYADVHHEFGHWEGELMSPQPRAEAIQQRAKVG